MRIRQQEYYDGFDGFKAREAFSNVHLDLLKSPSCKTYLVEIDYTHDFCCLGEITYGFLIMHSSSTDSTLEILRHVAPQLSSDFTGFGIVFYDILTSLPYLQLAIVSDESFDLPVRGTELICEVLAQTSRLSSAWHDGFHFVDAGSRSLTHLCQYIAPPLPTLSNVVPLASGARHMTALLASRVVGISAVGLLTRDLNASIYESGQLIWNEVI